MLPYSYDINPNEMKKICKFTCGWLTINKYDNRILPLLKDFILSDLANIIFQYIGEFEYINLNFLYKSIDISPEIGIVLREKSLYIQRLAIRRPMYHNNCSHHTCIFGLFNYWMKVQYSIENYFDHTAMIGEHITHTSTRVQLSTKTCQIIITNTDELLYHIMIIKLLTQSGIVLSKN